MLNIICDVIRDVVDKHVYIWRIWLIGQLDISGNDWLNNNNNNLICIAP